MKKIATIIYAGMLLSIILLFNNKSVTAQSWNLIGNAATIPGTNFIGTTDNKDFVFKTFNTEKGRVKANGLWQFGAAGNAARIDSGGNLSFVGNGAYKVAANKYAFQYAGNPNYGLFFNATGLLYEFRTSSALSVFSIGANSGNGIFKGTLKIGAYTLPATDGTNGQVLQTNGAGAVAWATVSGGSGANTALSNLTTTSINQSLVPSVHATYDLGSGSKYWKDIYSTGIIFHNGNRFIQSDNIYLTFVGVNAGGSLNTGGNNTFIGGSAGFSNTSGYNNTFTGASCGYTNLTGFANSFYGVGAGAFNNNGRDNTFVGNHSGFTNVDGNYNSIFGSGAGELNSSGSNNSMFGYLAGNSTSTGSYNCFYGISSGQLNNAGNYNSFYGINSGLLNTSGGANTFVGESAGYTNSTGNSNTFIGGSAGRIATGNYNTFLGAGSGRFTTTGDENAFTGFQSGYNNQDGTWNVFSGVYCGYNNTSGSYNTFLGKNAGFDNTLGNYNVMIGYSTGTGNNTGSNNVFIGNLARGTTPASGQLTNAVAIGNSALVEQSNSIVLGAVGTSVGINITSPAAALQVLSASGTGVTAISSQSTVSGGNGAVTICNTGSSAYGVWGQSSTGYAGYFSGNVTVTGVFSNPSDEKLKENVQPLTNALSKLSQLNAKTYNFKPEYAKMNLPSGTQFGFIAQDVEKVFPELITENYDKAMDEKNPMEYKGINYIEMIPVLTEAIKEQQKQIDSKDSIIAQQQTAINAMNARMNQFEQSLSQCCSDYKSSAQSGMLNPKSEIPSLEQNVPNPFSQNCYIRFYIPSSAKIAAISVTDMNGKTVKTFNNLAIGFGTVNINGGELASGDYLYTLTVDGNKVETRKMILTKN